MQENPVDAKYEISRTVNAGLAAITRIYNASVLEQNATATLHPVGIEEREAWFGQIARYTCCARFAT